MPIELVHFEQFELLERAKQGERSSKNTRTRRKTIEQLIATFPPKHCA